MNTHPAVVTVAPRSPLEIRHVVSLRLTGNQVRIRNDWTTSGPLDLHKADGGLLVSHPEVLGGTVAGTVIELGEEVKDLKLGDEVFGFGWRSEQEKSHQTFSVLPENLLAKIPPSLSMQEAVTIPTNLVTVFHTLTADFGFELPWPKPQDYKPAAFDTPVLVWGGSSSVGQYAIQVLRYYGYEKIVAVSSSRQHALLASLGAARMLDYSVPLETLLAELGTLGVIPYILDCIGSRSGSVYPISRFARAGSRVAVMLPVILRDSTVDIEPEYSMHVDECAEWQKGVDIRGVRTHFYLQNEFLARHLQSDIMPALVEQGVVKPNKYRVVEGQTMLERAQRALDMLREKEVSGEKMVWRVNDNDV